MFADTFFVNLRIIIKPSMLRKKAITIASVSFLILFTGMVPVQNSGPTSVQKTSKIKLLETKDFKRAEVGSPAIAGTVTVSDGGFDIVAGGADIWGVKDEFNYVYIEKSGDFDFAARIESLTAPHLYTKAGLMAREDLTPGSRHIYFQVFPDNKPRNKNNGGFEYQYRQQTGGEMKAIYPDRADGTPDFPVTFPNTWIRLKRVGNNFTGYTGIDGKTWKEYASFTLDLPARLYLGAAVTSHKINESATAKFRSLCNIIK
jgi:hypothetical protein